MQKNMIEPNETEAAAIETATKRLKRGREKGEEARLILRHRVEDADLRGERLPVDTLRSLEEIVTDSEDLVTKLEADLQRAIDAPARRAQRDARAAELRDAADAIHSETASLIERLCQLQEKGDAVAHALMVEFGDPQTGGRTMLPPFRGSNLPILLRWTKKMLTPERVKEYRRLSSGPQVSAPVKVTTPKASAGRILPRAERATRDQAMRASSKLTNTGVVVETGR